MSYGSHSGVKCAYTGHLATLISFYKRVIYKCHEEMKLLCIYFVYTE